MQEGAGNRGIYVKVVDGAGNVYFMAETRSGHGSQGTGPPGVNAKKETGR
jgi:hypothetical protein